MNQLGFTVCYSDGHRANVCPAGAPPSETFRPWMCQLITDALVQLVSNEYAEGGRYPWSCRGIGLSLSDRFVDGKFRLIYGFIEGGGDYNIGDAASGGVVELSSDAFRSATYNLVNLLAHEEAHFDLPNVMDRLQKHVGDICGHGEVR